MVEKKGGMGWTDGRDDRRNGSNEGSSLRDGHWHNIGRDQKWEQVCKAIGKKWDGDMSDYRWRGRLREHKQFA